MNDLLKKILSIIIEERKKEGKDRKKEK